MNIRLRNYDFHGLVSMQVVDHVGRRVAPAADPFPTFQVDALSDTADLTLELGDFEASPADCYLVDHKFHVRRNYLYCEDSWRDFRWKVEIEGFESGPIHVRLAMRGGGLRGALLPGLYSRMLLTRQLLARKLREKGNGLTHAAGAAREGRAVVMFGRGGAYKTSVLMSLLRSGDGWRALGDDAVVLRGKQALSFPTYPGLFAYRMAHKADEALTALDRIRYMLNPPAVEAVAGYFTTQAEIAALVEMRSGGVEAVTIEKVPLAENLAAMKNGIHLEAHNSVNLGFNDVYPRYVEAYRYVFPQNDLQETREFGAELAGLPAYRVTLPASPTWEDFQTVLRFLS